MLGSLSPVEPPKCLAGRILSAIELEQKRAKLAKAWAFGSASLASLGLSLWAVVYLVKSIQESGMWQYLSLIFSENGLASLYWRELSLSLAESLPYTGLIFFLSAVGFFIWSVANTLKAGEQKFIMDFN